MADARQFIELDAKLTACVSFARWCYENKVSASDAGQLMALAKSVYRAATREANGGSSASNIRRRFIWYAAALGFGSRFDGLMPSLTVDNRIINLPVL